MRVNPPRMHVLLIALVSVPSTSTPAQTTETAEGPADPFGPARPPAPAVVDPVNRSDAPTAPRQASIPYFPLPPDVQPRTIVVPAGTHVIADDHDFDAASTSAADTERLIYSNTHGRSAIQLRAHRQIADDLTLNARPGCRLRRYDFQIVTRVDPNGLAGPVTCTFALYNNCPQAGGVPLDGTQGSVSFSADQIMSTPWATIVVLVPESAARPAASTLWLAVRFNRDNAGVVMGAPAFTGFSGDLFDFPHLVCSTNLGGFPSFPHGSFNADIFGDAGECIPAYVGYRNVNPGPNARNLGRNVQFADDLTLNVSECDLIGYEVGVRGQAFYQVTLYRDAGDLPGTSLPSAGAAFLHRTNDAAVLHQPIDPPIRLTGSPDIKLWAAVAANTDGGGLIRTGRNASVGFTAATFAERTSSGWELQPEEHGFYGGYYANIICAALPPAGACCDMFVTQCDGGLNPEAPCAGNEHCDGGICGSACREVPLMNCPFPPPRSSLEPEWVQGASCHPDPFPRPCGQAACCKPDDTCENMTHDECNSVEPRKMARAWQRGSHCHEGVQDCPFNACLQEEGSCTLARKEPGCESRHCCADVCEVDPYCCRVEWDRTCLEIVDLVCNLPPENDVCAPDQDFDGATLVEVPGSAITPASRATTDADEPGFCCHSGFESNCFGGNSDGMPCLLDKDCEGGTCPSWGPRPGERGSGTVWYKFVAPHTSAELNAGFTDPSLGTTLMKVFATEDPTNDQGACDSLTETACLDDLSGLPLCVRGLTPGALYYVAVAAKLGFEHGLYRLAIDAPCGARQRFWNNHCSDAQVIAADRTPFDFFAATADCPILECGDLVRRDLWFEYHAEESRTINVGACTTGIQKPRQLSVAVYEGCDCPLAPDSLIACTEIGDPYCRDRYALPLSVTAGTCYKIRLIAPVFVAATGELCINCRYCPPAVLRWSTRNPDGVVDAARPYDPADPAAIEGLVDLTLVNLDVDASCWSLCETNNNPDLHPAYPADLLRNEILGVNEPQHKDAPFQIFLKRPLTPGETTFLTYHDETGFDTTARFTAHPADVNEDGTADVDDLDALIECLRNWRYGYCTLPTRSTDINRDGKLDNLDILELIDLLVGAGAYQPWLNTTVPHESDQCP